ncbi:MAG: nucleotidyltransferase domain-containing protein [Myxococcaceae bacterium]|nr:nucleotidyltransferase domain-containing protein [Myxococcaceae bacterium]
MNGLLTPHQTAVAEKFLAEESAKRRHLVISLSGAHAYGFPSPDSDLDLKAIHIAPTRELLGLSPEPSPVQRMEIIDGVELDYSSNELQHVLKSVLNGNGNYVERVLGHLQPYQGEALASLRPVVKQCLSRELYRHYNGFARQQFKEWEKTGFKTTKKLLYVVRTTMTGIHVLLTGEIVTDVSSLIGEYALTGVAELIEQKKRGEKSEMPEVLAAEWRTRVDGFFQRLDSALASSLLPPQTTETAKKTLEDWLLDLRRQQF